MASKRYGHTEDLSLHLRGHVRDVQKQQRTCATCEIVSHVQPRSPPPPSSLSRPGSTIPSSRWTDVPPLSIYDLVTCVEGSQRQLSSGLSVKDRVPRYTDTPATKICLLTNMTGIFQALREENCLGKYTQLGMINSFCVYCCHYGARHCFRSVFLFIVYF